MHVVMRKYSGESVQKFGDLMLAHKSELEGILRGVKEPLNKGRLGRT